MIAISQAIPFIGFGFMDNAILIIAGDAIDTSLGVMFGISTLCAAAIGNIISDICGIGLGTVIEDFCAQKLNLPVPNISSAQRKLRSVRFAGQLGMAFGMTFGCILGKTFVIIVY
jgi:tRNA-specific adenosine deaminase 1